MIGVPHYNSAYKEFFKNISSEGWRLCPQGYAVYAKKISSKSDSIIILHGLKVNGYSTAQGKIPGLSIKLDKLKIEEHLGVFLKTYDVINASIDSMLAESIHEIRSVNTALYHASYQLQGMLANSGQTEALARNTTALSELISARISLIDALAAESSVLEEKTFPVSIYKKFDKVYKCFIALGKAQKINISMAGNSRLNILGNDHSDLIPLLLIDNACKYSPDGEKITIEFCDDHVGDYVVCKVISQGPRVVKEEKELIFLRGYRGENAKKSGKSGSGIGLYFLKKLVSESRGSISFSQSPDTVLVKGFQYARTTFELRFPRYKA
ncbi:sensor histidine kinase [Pseudomonas yamanorum]|uniref:sensor histidine kinase n=1 Tax=Pseudomonas yamanorum TaxID=515393 RepID=UPI00210F1598|nr:HAMP domain-containing sensor histidine kinase [Pseudomonas yamanorum]